MLDWNRQALLQSPMLTPLHPVISALGADSFPALPDCNALLAARDPAIAVRSGKPLRFVPQQYGKLAFEAQYEPRCYLSGEVQMREHHWHDLLNALVWMTFPQAKAAINARHYDALRDRQKELWDTTRSQRGAVRDTSTLFDESGVIVASADAGLLQQLRDFQWKALFWERRVQVRAGMGCYLFGHGLYEKALQPYLGITGQALLLEVEPGFFTWQQARQLAHLDGLLADYLADPQHCRSTRELAPLPLLGVPGWAAENECAEYYDNTNYFRPGRRGHR